MMVISVAIKSGSRVFDQGRRILAKFIAPQKGPFYPHISLCGVFSQLDFQQNYLKRDGIYSILNTEAPA